jgi:hypothetical protein
MATTSAFGWETPDDTDLVKDGAAAIRTLGSSIDTSMAELKGGTTGQVLSKTSATDMDFTWVTTDDANAIQNAIVDAKGDLIAASAADTPARLAVGANGETLVADSSTSTGLRYQGNFAAGKNKIINGDFANWQRGTSFVTPSIGAYFADRFQLVYYDAKPTSQTFSQQTFTPGTAPVSGYESQYFMRSTITTVGSCTLFDFTQKIEDVRTFAGQTITYSFWAKADSARTVLTYMDQNFGVGGSGTVQTGSTTFNLTTSWARFSATVTLGSMTGKTIGTSSFLALSFRQAAASGSVIDVWGVQVESGSTATAFQTATGTIQGELAACQRYYQFLGGAASNFIVAGYTAVSSSYRQFISFPVQMRIAPTMAVNGTWAVLNTSQPTAAFISNAGFAFTMQATATGQLFSYPDSSDDTITASAEL